MTRRRLLEQAALGAAGASLVSALPLSAADAADLGAAPGDPALAAAIAALKRGDPEKDPNFLAGLVQSANSAGTELVVADADGHTHDLELVSSSSVWRSASWNQEILRPGDCVFARGELAAGGVLQAERTWANISNTLATVLRASTNEVAVRLPSGAETTTGITDRTAVDTGLGTVVNGDGSVLIPGSLVQLIEYLDPASAQFFASSITVYPASPSAAAASDPEDEHTKAGNGCVEKGLTTWFCCGVGNSGCAGTCTRCGGCGTGGSCGGCASDQNHAAWPQMPGSNWCNKPTLNCAYGSTYPTVGCGAPMGMANQCNSDKSVSLTIKDCGPQRRCVNEGSCVNYRKVKFDITPCAFTKIGNLDTGFRPVTVIVLGCS